MARPLLIVMACGGWLVTAGPALSQSAAQSAPAQTTAAQPAIQSMSRDVRLEGVEDGDLRKELRALSVLTDTGRRYTSLAAIRRTARDDADKMLEALTSKGYYAAEVIPRALRDGDGVIITFTVDLGPKFTIATHRIVYTDAAGGDAAGGARPETFAAADIEAGPDPAGETLLRHETALVTWLQRNGYPQARAGRHYVRANFNTGRATAVYEMESGLRARFGEARVEDGIRTQDSFIAAYAPWEEGALYDQRKLIEYRERLAETGLFRQISVEPGPVNASPGHEGTALEGRTDILVSVTERKRRTAGAGVSYATDVGPGVSLFWENRNLLRHGEKLTAQAKIATPEQLVGLSFARPLPVLPGRFNMSATASNEVSDAFEAKSLELNTSLSKTWFSRRLEAAGGVGYIYTEVRDALTDSLIREGEEPEAEPFSYFKFPASLTWDSTNDVLNPTSGFRLGVTTTPFVGDAGFLRASVSGATRTTLGEEARTVLAVRGTLGTTFGASTQDIPATERFYAGGGGSIRGYAYQEAGPLGEDGDPIGGSSIFEINTEARYRVRDKMQVAAFVDGGTVSANEFPDFSEDTLWGAGLGLRYMTPIGPLRADIATPLTPRERDDPVQFYIALGQPF